MFRFKMNPQQTARGELPVPASVTGVRAVGQNQGVGAQRRQRRAAG